MAMLMIDTENNRTAKALQIAADAGQWIKVRSKDGQPLAFGVPSQRNPSHYYMVTARSCQCVDFKHRGQPCKHVQAVAIYVALRRASQNGPRRRAA